MKTINETKVRGGVINLVKVLGRLMDLTEGHEISEEYGQLAIDGLANIISEIYICKDTFAPSCHTDVNGNECHTEADDNGQFVKVEGISINHTADLLMNLAHLKSLEADVNKINKIQERINELVLGYVE